MVVIVIAWMEVPCKFVKLRNQKLCTVLETLLGTKFVAYNRSSIFQQSSIEISSGKKFVMHSSI